MSEGPAAERRAEFVAVADRLAGRFAERAAAHDLEATFPHENYADLADAGLLRLSVPEELGGLRAGLGDVVAVLERLATGDGATALAVTMHISPLGQWSNVWRRTGAPRLAHLLRQAAEGSLVWAAVTGEPGVRNDMTDARTAAEKVDGGFVLTGRKVFATNTAVATHFSTTARHEDADGGPRLLLCQVAMDQPGVRVHPTWNAMGMRATCATVKYVAATNAVEVLQQLVDVVGGPAYTRNQPFERMWRDVQAGPIMPMGNLAARRLIGADTLGVTVAPVS